MSGPITAKWRLATKTFGAYHAEILRLLKKEKSNATDSDDADLVGGYDWTGLLKPARDDLAAHIARKDNPHTESMESHGSYSATAINQKLANKIPNSVVPVSSYGIVDELTSAQVDASWSASGWILKCSLQFQCVLSGTVFRLPPQQLNLTAVDAAPANKTFNIYVRAQFGYVTYEARTDSPPESASVMYIGRATTGPNGIIGKVFISVLRIDTFRISADPLGSVFPITGGTYDAPAKLPTAWNP